MILTKVICETRDGYMCSFRDGKKSICLTGNIPEFPIGTNISVCHKNGKITDYRYILTERNEKLLDNRHINKEEFLEKLDMHKFYMEDGILWRDLKEIENPYSVFSFARADRIHHTTKNLPLAKERLSAFVREVIERFRKKRMTKYSLDEYITEFRNVESFGSYPYLSLSKIVETIQSEAFLFQENKLWDKEYYEAEEFIRRNIEQRNCVIHDLMTYAEIEEYLKNDNMSSEEQKDAVRELESSNVTVVTGGAGVGKSTTINKIIGCYANYYGKEYICLIAPTGKASRRMTEVTGFEASTIHSRLRKTPSSDFIYYNEYNPLPYRLYVVDESSMIDTLLMRDLLMAIPEGAKIVFVGDFNQLFPVGCGEPFHDFIKNDMCKVVWLTKNFRQKTGLVLENANRILGGEPLVAGEDFRIISIRLEDIEHYIREDIQNISPYNELNDLINSLIVKQNAEKKHNAYGFYVGEKIITLENENDYSNGDIGVVTAVLKDGIDISINGKTVFIPNRDMKGKKVLPAFALTVHKMQGSECQEVNIFIPKKPSEFISKRLMYTAVTRAKKKVTLYLY